MLNVSSCALSFRSDRNRVAFSMGAAVLAATLLTPDARGDSVAQVSSPAGASMVATMTITITTALGTSSDSDTKTIAMLANGSAQLAPSAPPWNAVTIDALHLDPADTTFHFDLYCFPFIGCQPLDVAVSGLTIDSTAPMSSILTASGGAIFPNANFMLLGAYSATGVATATGTLENATTATFACRVQALAKSQVKFDQLSLAPIVNVVDAASLPSGVTALTITFASNLTNTTLSGMYVAVNPYDLNGDGVVDAADLSTLLAQWGGAGNADLDGDGLVGAADLAMLLSNWG